MFNEIMKTKEFLQNELDKVKKGEIKKDDFMQTLDAVGEYAKSVKVLVDEVKAELDKL